METRTCHGKYSCGEEKPKTEFYQWNNQGYMDNLCKCCRSKRNCETAAKKLRATRPLRKAGRKPHYDKPVSEVVNNFFHRQLVI